MGKAFLAQAPCGVARRHGGKTEPPRIGRKAGFGIARFSEFLVFDFFGFPGRGQLLTRVSQLAPLDFRSDSLNQRAEARDYVLSTPCVWWAAGPPACPRFAIGRAPTESCKTRKYGTKAYPIRGRPYSQSDDRDFRFWAPLRHDDRP